jgi:hypothetical protein
MGPKTGSEMGCLPKNLIYGRLLGIRAFRYTGFSVVGLLGIRAFGYMGFSVLKPVGLSGAKRGYAGLGRAGRGWAGLGRARRG